MYPEQVLVLFLLATCVWCQFDIESFRKAGECPDLYDTPVCSRTCQFDAFCPRNLRCCRTGCGGTVCAQPKRSRKPKTQVKAGTCPTNDDWVCSSTCAIDKNCPGRKKCCKTEGCGGYICLQPEDL